MTGSTRAARQAGTAAATNAASSSVPSGSARLQTSSAATSNSIVSTKRDAYSPPARPQAAPISVVPGGVRQYRAHRADRARPERDADADLARALHDRIAQRAVQPDGRQHEPDQREEAGEQREQPLAHDAYD